MAVVYLIRHGQASFGAADYDVLSPMGVQQSKVVGEELARRGVRADQVWSGTLSRQRATAAGAVPDVECREDPRWNEYDMDTLLARYLPSSNLDPAAAAASPKEFQRLLERAMTAWSEDTALTGPGSWRSFCDDPCVALNEVFDSLGRGGIGLVFTSGGVISAVCASLLGLAPQGFLAVNRTMVNAGITKVVRGSLGTSLVSLNEHAHFEGPNRELLSYR